MIDLYGDAAYVVRMLADLTDGQMLAANGKEMAGRTPGERLYSGHCRGRSCGLRRKGLSDSGLMRFTEERFRFANTLGLGGRVPGTHRRSKLGR